MQLTNASKFQLFGRSKSVSMHLRFSLAAFLLIAMIFISNCASPRYNNNYGYSIDQSLEYRPGLKFEEAILRKMEEAKRGVEIIIHAGYLNEAYRPLQRWIVDIQNTDGRIDDPDNVMRKYPLLQPGNAKSGFDKFKDNIANKTEGVFKSGSRNKRLAYAQRHRIAIREKGDTLLFYFVPRGKSESWR